MANKKILFVILMDHTKRLEAMLCKVRAGYVLYRALGVHLRIHSIEIKRGDFSSWYY